MSAWTFLADHEPPPAVRCVSVGWLIEDGDVKALAPNMGGLESGNSLQVSGVIRIPARCVLRVVKIKEPALSRRSGHG